MDSFGGGAGDGDEVDAGGEAEGTVVAGVDCFACHVVDVDFCVRVSAFDADYTSIAGEDDTFFLSIREHLSRLRVDRCISVRPGW